MNHEPKSIWWGLLASFWYWWDYGIPLFGEHDTAFWHGFNLRACCNDPTLMVNEPGESARDAVATDVSYWEP